VWVSVCVIPLIILGKIFISIYNISTSQFYKFPTSSDSYLGTMRDAEMEHQYLDVTFSIQLHSTVSFLNSCVSWSIIDFLYGIRGTPFLQEYLYEYVSHNKLLTNISNFKV
jgi:hypothetical protein